MPPEESFNPLDWLRIAEKDLDRAMRLLDDGDADGAGFNLQQAVEKFIKAYLLSRGWPLKKTHNLDSLMSELVKYLPELESSRSACQRITDFYLSDRYPFMLDSGPDVSDVRMAMGEVQPLIEKIKSQFK